MATRLDNCVLAALRFEMIFRLVKYDAGALLDVMQHFLRKLDMTIQTGADRGSAQRNFAPSFDGLLRARLRVRDLLRVTGKFLAEPDRRRIHQMRSADFYDVPKFLRFCFKRCV